jgi:hypothetical protein
MTPEHTLAVDCNVRDSGITHSKYAALRVKDAICDQQLERHGRRPSVDTETPMVGLNLHIHRDEAVLSLDSSGESLHKRGYRPILTKAPLNEALAAGILLLTGWKADVPLVDPLCGSGTLPIEAAWMALHRPPGLTRKRFGFQGWMDFDVALWAELRDEARRGVKKALPVSIHGSDVRRDAITFSINNAKAAGIGHLLRFYDVQKGSVSVDGVDVREWDLAALRRRFGVVLRCTLAEEVHAAQRFLRIHVAGLGCYFVQAGGLSEVDPHAFAELVQIAAQISGISFALLSGTGQHPVYGLCTAVAQQPL